jgi:hypothetical protein
VEYMRKAVGSVKESCDGLVTCLRDIELSISANTAFSLPLSSAAPEGGDSPKVSVTTIILLFWF